MQYSTLRISALVAIFSATALAQLDCGGGRAPPKTTVPGCPGYVGPGPTSVSTVIVTPTRSTVSASITISASSGSASSDSQDYSLEAEILNQFVESSGVNDGLCQCSGYLCSFARPGCVSINKDGVRSTITANPGYQSRTFDINAYSSYTATAGPLMFYSADGDMISFPAGTVSMSQTTSSTRHTVTATSSGKVTATATEASSSAITASHTSMTTMATATATANSTLSTHSTLSANSTLSVNSTAPVATHSTGDASRASAFGSLAIIFGLGMGAMAWL